MDSKRDNSEPTPARLGAAAQEDQHTRKDLSSGAGSLGVAAGGGEVSTGMLREHLTTALRARYGIQRELGAGGMATVYLAHDHRHGRDVALKVMHPSLGRSMGGELFLREIRLAAKLSHPHILPLYDSGEAEGLLYYVMPNVEGHSLRERLNEVGKLPIEEAVRVAKEVAGALEYAHRHGVVHRDIKPANIMLHAGHAMVADFGIGKALGAVEAGSVLTQTGMSIGTPAYMSPEQAAGEPVDARSDIYSLGCVFYEMLTGEQPFTGATVQAVIAKRFMQTPADVRGLREGVPRTVATAVHKALARAPIDRFESAAELGAALGQSRAESVESSGEAEAPDRSIAVLPFASLSTDPENEYFADGITEEILNALSRIPDLRVTGRSSAFAFKRRNQDVRSIGELLKVRSVLEGSVRRAGRRVRIVVQLTDVGDGYQIWSERYDREIEDVFAVQDEIAAAIAGRLKAGLLRSDAAAAAQRATGNMDAYQAYLKGRALLYRRGASIRLGLAQMQRALELDPGYGLAWAGIADAHSLFGYYGILSPEEASSVARRAAGKALELAPDLAEAHTAAAFVRLMFDWDWEGAERAFARSYELNPRYVQGRGWYACFYLGFVCARWDEAIGVINELLALDEFSSYLHGLLAVAHCVGGDPAECLRHANRAIELDPEAFLSLWSRQLALIALGNWEEALAAGHLALAVSGRGVLPLALLGHTYVSKGDIDAARDIFAEMTLRGRREPVSGLLVAGLAAALGDGPAALEYARQSVARKDPAVLIYSLRWPQYAALRALPEFRSMLAAIRLPGWRPGSPGWVEASADAGCGAVSPAAALSPEEQMALFEKELKENDWGHQPC